jgi:hypothetical protein
MEITKTQTWKAYTLLLITPWHKRKEIKQPSLLKQNKHEFHTVYN